jgi:hypothetical protein
MDFLSIFFLSGVHRNASSAQHLLSDVKQTFLGGRRCPLRLLTRIPAGSMHVALLQNRTRPHVCPDRDAGVSFPTRAAASAVTQNGFLPRRSGDVTRLTILLFCASARSLGIKTWSLWSDPPLKYTRWLSCVQSSREVTACEQVPGLISLRLENYVLAAGSLSIVEVIELLILLGSLFFCQPYYHLFWTSR